MPLAFIVPDISRHATMLLVAMEMHKQLQRRNKASESRDRDSFSLDKLSFVNRLCIFIGV